MSFRAELRQPLSLKLSRAVTGILQFAAADAGHCRLVQCSGLFERLHVTRAESFEHIHGLIETAKRGLALRERICTDFAHLPRAIRLTI